MKFSPALFSSLLALLTTSGLVRANDSGPFGTRPTVYSSKGAGVMRQYSTEERIRYQLWDYTWHPDLNEPITRIEISISQQHVYVYQGDNVAADSPVTTGKPHYDTPPGHYKIMVKDIDHKSNLYGVFLDANGNVVDGNAKVGDKPPPGSAYDAADMPYYMRLRDDGVGMHAGYLPGYAGSHGCIRLPHAFAELLFSNVSVGTPVDVVP
jgi:lipoprotein-anchoring transpeptidase ErfK/SrfK